MMQDCFLGLQHIIRAQKDRMKYTVIEGNAVKLHTLQPKLPDQ